MRPITTSIDYELVHGLKRKGYTAKRIAEICGLKPGQVDYLLYQRKRDPSNGARRVASITPINASEHSVSTQNVVEVSIPSDNHGHTYNIPLQFKVSLELAR